MLTSAVIVTIVWLGTSAFRASEGAGRPAPTERLLEADPDGPNDALAAAGLPDDAFDRLESDRPIYRYSVVPGGTYDADELRHAVSADPVVAAHYSKLDPRRVHKEIVANDRYVHVSYRKGNDIFWTKKKVLLRKGETILTDGTTQVRTRCGNCISDEPLGATAADEPDVVEFDRLVDSIAPRTETPGTAAASAKGESAGVLALQPGGTPGPTTFGAPALIGGGAPPFIGGPTGADDPLVRATRSGSREPGDAPAPPAGDASTPDNPQGPGTGKQDIDLPVFTELTVPPGGVDDPPPFDDLLPPGFGQPNGPDGFGPPSENPPIVSTGNDPVNPVPVPEPGTIMLVGGGVAALVRRLRARSR